MIKKLSLGFTLLLLFVLAPIGYLLLTDANDFKPHLQRLAREQGVELDIAGDLSWQLYPDILLEVAQAHIQTSRPSMNVDASVGKARLQVALWPLFSRQLDIRGVEILDSKLSLTEVFNGADRSMRPEAQHSGSADIQIQQILLSNLEVQYQPIDAPPYQLLLETMEWEALNLDGKSFPVQLAVTHQYGEQRIHARGEMQLSLDQRQRHYSLNTRQLEVHVDGEHSLATQLSFTATINLESHQWSLTLNSAQVEDMEVKANMSGGLDPVSALGQVELQGGSGLLNRLAGQPLVASFSARTNLDYSLERLVLREARVQINDSQLDADVQAYFVGDKPSVIGLTLDYLNLDDYLLGRETEKNDTAAEAQDPLAFLSNLPSANVQLTVAQLQMSQQVFSQLSLQAVIEDAKARLLMESQLAEGQISADLLLNASEQPQLFISEFKAQGINLAPLTLDERGQPRFSGTADLDFAGQLQRVSGKNRLQGLDGRGDISVSQLVLEGINIEQSICVSAQQLGATAALTDQWQPGTRFDQMNSPFVVSKGQLDLQQIGTGFGNIKLTGEGALDLNSQAFQAKLSLLVDGERTSEQGCSINRYLRRTPLPLSCQGQLAAEGASSCGLDRSVVRELLKGQIKNQLGRKLDQWLGGKTEEVDTEQKAETTGSGNSSDQVKDAVRGLLEGLLKE